VAKPAPDIESVYAEACQLLNEQGEAGLSMRNLAHRAGCSPMSLYTHIGKRDDLLEGIVQRFFQSIDIQVPAGGGWQQQVLEWARQLRAAYLDSPGIVAILRPGARWAVEATVSKQLYRLLLDAGFDETTATSLCRTFFWQVTALSTMEVMSGKQPAASSKSKPVETGQYHRQLAKKHTLQMAGDIFDYSIALMLDGIDRENRSGNPPTVLRT